MYLQRAVTQIDEILPDAPFVRPGGSLLMMVGLPGTGKSSVVNSLQRHLSHVVVGTDNVRAHLRRQPTYTAAEMMLVYEVSYSLIEMRLNRGQRVVFDASNYLAARREYVTGLATRCGAPVAVCHVQASQQVIRARLSQRNSDARPEGDLSDADWDVYKWMVEAQEPVAGSHLIADTTAGLSTELAGSIVEYWLDVEASAARNPDLQSPSWARKLSHNR